MKTPLKECALVLLLWGSTAFAKTAPLRPNHRLTPGMVTNVSAQALCAKQFHTRDERHVTKSQANHVYEEYGIMSRRPREYEIDHLISLELGGSNDTRNLWPQSYVTTPWNAHVKDQLETRLHWMICHKRITLKQAQKEIAADWIACYKRHIASKPLSKLPPPETSAH
jgi:hypothetical protein